MLDKTGTLTKGKPEVTEMIWQEGLSIDKQILEGILLDLEQQSEHPVAEAIVNYLRPTKTETVAVEEFESLTGKGVHGFYKGQQYWAGSHKILVNAGISINDNLLKSVEGFQKRPRQLFISPTLNKYWQ
ncbi:HAD family hydrolase [Pedobacter fastidiosus]|uniref:HAD family hydrolase n=1 Tax=Pedobacter fastidiosus TaxID=2765361 RepID=UPI0036142265